MTVLTLPSTGSKSDKVPLVDHEAAVASDRSPASPDKQSAAAAAAFDPKRLEAGDLEPLQQRDLREIRHRLRWTVRGKLLFSVAIALAMTMFVFALLHLACHTAADLACKKCHHGGISHEDAQRLREEGAMRQREEDATTHEVAAAMAGDTAAAAAGSKPCKSFTSYDAAEKDMAQVRASAATEQPPPPQSEDDYDTALQFNTMISSTGGGEETANFKRLEDYAINKAIMYSRKILDGLAVLPPHKAIVSGSGVGGGETAVKVVATVAASDSDAAPSAPISMTKSARFIHDFSINITGIVDPEGQRCFVMSLVRNDITAPSSLDDLLEKMTTGYYSSDLSEVLNHMRIVKPALNLTQSDYGLYISRDCADYPTFKLEKNVVSTTAQPPVTEAAALAAAV